MNPARTRSAFICPHTKCGAYANVTWHQFGLDGKAYTDPKLLRLGTAKCTNCKQFTVWVDERMVFPALGTATPPNTDMPDRVRELYDEASKVSTLSPRAAGGLLRLAVQELCDHLGHKGLAINNAIAELVKGGLPVMVQQSLDIVRVTGNDAVHPGQIDTDDPATINELFGLLNIITTYMVSMPKQVSTLYQQLPQAKREAIEKRDAAKP